MKAMPMYKNSWELFSTISIRHTNVQIFELKIKHIFSLISLMSISCQIRKISLKKKSLQFVIMAHKKTNF